MADFFLSYSRTDKDWVGRLAIQLTSLDRETLVDVEGILPSEEWRERLEQMIREADVFVFVLSDASAASGECARELEIAERFAKRVVPLNHRLTGDELAPGSLGDLQRIEAPPEKDIARVAEELCAAHDTDIDRVRLHTRLLTKAADWEANVRGSLLSGDALAEAERFVAAEDADPGTTVLQRRFVQASRSAATRRRRVVGAIAVAVLVAFAVGGWFARNQQLASQCNDLLGEARSSISTDPAAARRHALEAAESCRGDLRPSLDRLVARLLLSPRPVRRVGPVAGSSVLLSTDGSLLAAGPARTKELGGSTAGLDIWRLEDAALLATLEDVSAPPATLHATDKSLIVVDATGQLGIWNRDGGQPAVSVELAPNLRKTMLDGRIVDFAPADSGGYVVRVWDGGGGPSAFTFGSGASSEAVLDPWFEFRVETAGDKVRLVPLDGKPRELPATTEGGLTHMLSVAVSPDGAFLAGSNENAVDVWRRNGTHAAFLRDSEESMQTWTLGFDSESRWLITTQGKGEHASIWDLSGLRTASGLEVSHPFERLYGSHWLRDAQFGPDAATAVTLQAGGHAVVWNTGLPVAHFDFKPRSHINLISGSGWRLELSGGHYTLHSPFDPDLRIEPGKTGPFVDPSGRFELQGSEDGRRATLSLLRDGSRTELRRMSASHRFVDILGMSKDGRHYAVGSIVGSDQRFIVYRCDVCGLDAEAALQALRSEQNQFAE